MSKNPLQVVDPEESVSPIAWTPSEKLERFFCALRKDPAYSAGCGDVCLTLKQQEGIVDAVRRWCS